MKYELALPPPNLEQRLSFGVLDVLGNKRWEYQADLGVERRETEVRIGLGLTVTAHQSRDPVNTENVHNEVTLRTRRFRKEPYLEVASWYTGESELIQNSFRYTDSIELVLHRATKKIRSRDG